MKPRPHLMGFLFNPLVFYPLCAAAIYFDVPRLINQGFAWVGAHLQYFAAGFAILLLGYSRKVEREQSNS